MKSIKAVFRFVFALILTISLIVIFTINILYSTIMKRDFVLDKFEETGYYDKVLGIANSNFENYIIQSGLDKSVLENIITREDIVNDTQKIINNIYSNVEETITAENLKTKLQANIDNATKDMGLTEEQKNSLKGFINEIVSEYYNCIAHFEFEKTIFNFYHKADFILDVTYKAVLVFTGVALFGLAVNSSRRFYKFFVYVGISLFSAGLFFIVVNIFVNSKVNIQAITILNDALSFSLRDMLTTVFGSLFSNGMIMFFGGFCLIFISNLAHYFFKYRRRDDSGEELMELDKKEYKKQEKKKMKKARNEAKKNEKAKRKLEDKDKINENDKDTEIADNDKKNDEKAGDGMPKKQLNTRNEDDKIEEKENGENPEYNKEHEILKVQNNIEEQYIVEEIKESADLPKSPILHKVVEKNKKEIIEGQEDNNEKEKIIKKTKESNDSGKKKNRKKNNIKKKDEKSNSTEIKEKENDAEIKIKFIDNIENDEDVKKSEYK